MSPPRVLRTVAGMPPSSSVFWKAATASLVLGFRGLSSTWFRGIRLKWQGRPFIRFNSSFAFSLESLTPLIMAYSKEIRREVAA